MTDSVTLAGAPAPMVNADEHMALGTPDAIAADQSRGIKSDEMLPPVEEFSAPASSNGMVGVLHAAGMPGEVVSGAAKWLAQGVPGKSAGELAAMDATDLVQTRSYLQQVWGGKYQANLDALGRYIGGMPESEAEIVRNARDPATGRAYLNDPANVVRLAGLARAPQPAGTGPLTIEGIESFMRTNRAAYSRDEALQARYRNLLDLRGQAKGS